MESRRIYVNGINDALRMAHPLYSYPAGDETTHKYLLALFRKFHARIDPEHDLKSDRELTEEDMRNRMLVLYGTPENHSFFRRVRDKLPLAFESDGVVVGKKKCVGRDVGAIFICPNPLSPNHRMVIYGAVSPAALKSMNAVFHGPTDYIVFNDTTREFVGLEPPDRFIFLGAFDKSDPERWQADESLRLRQPGICSALRQPAS